MAALFIPFLFITLCYACMIWLLAVYWKRYPAFKYTGREMKVRLSVVIAFRNESSTLPGCLDSLEKQSLTAECFEVILSDDHSTDGSAEFAENYCRNHHGFRYCSPDDDRTGKKAALTRAIRIAEHEVIVLTDADCRADERWLETIAAFQSAHGPDMIIGLVDMKVETGLMREFQALEFLSLTGVSAGAAAMGRPVFCSSANLIFTRALFAKFTDPFRMDMISGDDTFFLHLVKKDRSKQIMLLKSRLAVVTTTGKRTLNGFLNQRKRWASKSIRYTDADTIVTALMTFFVNLVLIVSMALMVTGSCRWLFPLLFLIKISADLLLLKDVLKFFGIRTSIYRFVLYELVYMYYVILTVPVAFLVKSKWKN